MLATRELRDAVRDAYSAAADHPGDLHAFPVGREFAEEVGYPSELLDEVPRCSYDGFAGVSCASLLAPIEPGMCVLDLGCGAGLDSLIAAKRTGDSGRVEGVDFSDAMIRLAQTAATEVGLGNVHFRTADAECLPFDDGSFDLAMVNGIFNLNPGRAAIFRELARVVRKGGSVWVAELVLVAPLPPSQTNDESSWFA